MKTPFKAAPRHVRGNKHGPLGLFLLTLLSPPDSFSPYSDYSLLHRSQVTESPSHNHYLQLSLLCENRRFLLYTMFAIFPNSWILHFSFTTDPDLPVRTTAQSLPSKANLNSVSFGARKISPSKTFVNLQIDPDLSPTIGPLRKVDKPTLNTQFQTLSAHYNVPSGEQ